MCTSDPVAGPRVRRRVSDGAGMGARWGTMTQSHKVQRSPPSFSVLFPVLATRSPRSFFGMR